MGILNKKKYALYNYQQSSDGVAEAPQSIPLNKDKILIGNSESCDIKFSSDNSVSFIHAIIFIHEEKIFIQDLSSLNGVFINNLQIASHEKVLIELHDQITIGHQNLLLDEAPKPKSPSENNFLFTDKNVKRIQSKSNEDEIENSILPPIEDFDIIDGEYCNIRFSSVQKIVLENNPLLTSYRFQTESYIEIEENDIDLFEDREFNESEIEDVITPTHENKIISNDYKLEVSIFVMGVLVEYTLIDPKNTNDTYFLSSKKSKKNKIYCEELNIDKDIQIFTLSDNKIIPVGEVNEDITLNNISDKELHILGAHNVQIIFNLTNAPSRIGLSPYLGLDKATKKQAIKVFSTFFVFLLIMLITPTTQIKEQEEELLSIVFQPAPVEAPQASEQQQTSPTPSPVQEDTGVREQELPTPEQALAEAPPEPQQSQPEPEPQVAQVDPAPSVEPTPEPVVEESTPQEQTFALNTNSRMQRLSNRSQNTPREVQNRSRQLASTQATSVSDSQSVDAPQRGVGRIGSDRSGRASASSGARGLASREGFASSYIEPKTVVLGSMDPELLRKILREHLPHFRHCYQQELDRQNENLAGVLDLNFRILGTGSIDNVKIEVSNAEFSRQGTHCMSNVLRMIEFPKPKGGGIVDVRQPLNFSSETRKI